jgi:hypothetical protein
MINFELVCESIVVFTIYGPFGKDDRSITIDEFENAFDSSIFTPLIDSIVTVFFSETISIFTYNLSPTGFG